MVLMGPPGAGKGTQARMLAEDLGVAVVSTGDILREEVRRASALGKSAKAFMDKGALVPDELVVAMVRNRLCRDDCQRGFVLDGFPRTVEQAQALDAMLEERGEAIGLCVSISVPETELVRRLSGRRTCRVCGWMCHLLFDPPAKEGVCDRCGGELYQRNDDREEVIEERLSVYQKETAPVLSYYAHRGLLREIDGRGSREGVFASIKDELANRRGE